MISNNCPDCDAVPGQLHRPGCDVERCPYCGRQMIACEHSHTAAERPPDDDRLPWTGRWPGEAECERLGWYAKLVPGRGWVPCTKDEPGAEPDLNRLLKKARWDRSGMVWIYP
jgi:hypothetical protein